MPVTSPQPPLPKDSSDTAVLGVYVPNQGIVAVQGSVSTTDTYNIPSSPLLLADGGRIGISVYTLVSTVTTGSTQNSGDLVVSTYTELAIDLTTTAQAGTNPTIQYFFERKAGGLYYVIWQSDVLTAATNTRSASIGAGMAYNQSVGLVGRLRWVVGGTSSPTFTHALSITGK